VTNASNVTVVGSNNTITSPSSLDTAYVFGGSNNINLNGGGGAYLYGTGNTVTNNSGNGIPNPNLANAFAVGANNTIGNIGFTSNVYEFGVNNNIENSRNTGGQNDVSKVFAIGADNDLHNIPGYAASTLTNAYAFGGGNMMASGGMSSDVYEFGANNKILNPDPLNNGTIIGGYAFGDGNVINVPAGGNMANIYAIGANNTLGNGTMSNAYAIGGGNTLLASNAFTIGMENTLSASATNTFILGNNVASANANGVILGNNSADGVANPVTTVAIGANAPVAVAGFAPVGIVSVGAAGAERQIINVAAGRVAANSTDAVNGSELYATNVTLATVSATIATIANTVNTDALLWNNTRNAYDASRGAGVAQRITNVASGAINAASLDAVNGSQVYDVASRVANILGTGTVNSDGSVTNTTFATGGTTVNQAITNIYNTATALAANALQWNPAANAYDASRNGTAQKITNVAAGTLSATSLDAVNGSQLYTTNTTLASLGGTVASIGDTVSNLSNNSTTTTNLVNQITSGSAGIFRHDAATGNITIGSEFTGTLVDFSNATGQRKLTGVASGAINADSVDAVNGSQLYEVATNIARILGTGTVNSDGSITDTTFVTGGTTINEAISNIYNTATALATDALQWNPSLNAYDASHGSGTAQRITNVASGLVAENSLDAINGNQLYTTATSIVNALGSGSVNPDGSITGAQFTFNGGTYTNLGDTITNIDQTVSNIISGSIGLVRQDSATGDITIGAQTSGTLLSIANSAGDDRRITGVAAGTADNDAVNIGQLKAAGLVSGTGSETTIASVVTYDSAEKTTITLGGSPSTDGGMTGGTRITNLAQAALDAASTDAVNGAQLFATNQRVSSLETVVSEITSGTSTLATPHFSTGNDNPAIPATATGGNAVAAGMGATASGASSSAVGMGAVASAAQSVAIGSLAVSQATGGVALGNSAIVAATAANSVAIGANSVATEPNTVSFGTPDHERRLVNVADGINPTDAVNMRQFNTFGSAVNDRLANLQNQVNNVGDRVDNVGAMSAAMNQVQPRLNAGNHNQLALGVGGYRGHGAFAMGYGYTCPQGDRGVQASFALSDRGEVMAGAGAIFGW
jgi:autotransporter adhesin